MKHLIRLTTVLCCALMISSCASSYNGSAKSTPPITRPSNPSTDGLFSKSRTQFSIGTTYSITDYRIIQTINPHLGLAKSASGLVLAVQTSDSFDPFYDNLFISGQFVMISTYTYSTVPDEYGRVFSKTVPLVVPLRDYKELLGK